VAFCLRSQLLTDAGRNEIWRFAAKNISVKGSGTNTFWLVYNTRQDKESEKLKNKFSLNPAHAHNAILDAVVTRGIFGVVGLIMIFCLLPELAGLWSICMFNPVSFEVVFIGCVLVGLNRNLSARGIK
jgi:O-antigen ligase